MFSIVFPTKELLIDLKNSVSNSLFAFSCSFVFSSMCFFSRGFVKQQWSLTMSLSNEVLKIQKCVACLELRLSSPLKTIFLLKSNSLGISSMFSSNSTRMRATSSSSLFALHGVQAFLCLRSGSDTWGNTLLLSHPYIWYEKNINVSYFSLCWSSVDRITFITKHVYRNVFIFLFTLSYISQLHREVDITPVKLLRLCSDESCDPLWVFFNRFRRSCYALLKTLIICIFNIHDCFLTFSEFCELDFRATVQRSVFRKRDVKRYHSSKSLVCFLLN